MSIERKKSIIQRFNHILHKFLIERDRINSRMNHSISNRKLALFATALSLLIIVIALFITPYLGLANDNTVIRVMKHSGLAYLPQDQEKGIYILRGNIKW